MSRGCSSEVNCLASGGGNSSAARNDSACAKGVFLVKDVVLPAAALADIAAFFGGAALNPAWLEANKDTILNVLAALLAVKTPFTLTDAHGSDDGAIKALLAMEGVRELLTALVCLGAKGDMGANTSGFGFEASLWGGAAIPALIAVRHAYNGEAWAGDATKAVLGATLATGYSMARHLGIPYAGELMAFAGATALAAWPIASKVATYFGWGSKKAQGPQTPAYSLLNNAHVQVEDIPVATV